eukprot:Phypoly_transcript_18988.p1 GENE.Phypoly_transcript_18988~~Phypoly_transcript_18988.p1  ORF type:complete len:180 (+),score=13.52 Phypoly_transcript_18988:160-699(+)
MESQDEQLQEDPSKDFFPLCIVWSPIPCLTWLVPVIGHLGVASTEGIIYDFAGSYYIHKSKSKTGFGAVAKYWRIDPRKDIKYILDGRDERDAWDKAVESSSQCYESMTHNLICNNCHAHVAKALNQLEFRGITHWNTFLLILFMMIHSKYVSWGRLLYTWLPFLIIVTIIVVVSVLAS